MKKIKTYQENFTAGVKCLMADSELDTLKDVASHLGLAYMTLYKIMDRTRNPTTEHCITLCRKAGYSANWLFLDRGDMYEKKEITLQNIANDIKLLRETIDSERI